MNDREHKVNLCQKPPISNRGYFANAWQLRSGSLQASGPCSKLRFASSNSDVQLFLNSWSKALFGPILYSEAAHLFTKQLLCR
jgi:hypothetical protein